MIGSTARSGPQGSGTTTAPGPAQRPSESFAPARSTGDQHRLFPSAPTAPAPEDELRELAARMEHADGPVAAMRPRENLAIPAGYAHLCRLAEHDLTFAPSPARLDLGTVYGDGPDRQPYLYDEADPAKFRLGLRVSDRGPEAGPDLPRMGDVAVIADARNDDDVILGQLHGLLLRFHNAVVDEVRDSGATTPDEDFAVAHRLTRWHYQWVILNDLLPRLCGEDVMHDVLHREEFVISTGWSPDPAPLNPLDPGHPVSSTTEVVRPRLRFHRTAEAPAVPLEFSAAAFRLAPAMTRTAYVLNEVVDDLRDGRPVSTSRLAGHRPLPPQWGIDWRMFFRTSGEPHRPQAAHRIDERVHTPALPALIEGATLGLPSGQAVAGAMSIDPLPASRLGLAALPALERATPLWYYVLREAGELCQGCCLGPVGGRIVAETLVGLVADDPDAYLHAEPGWTPTLPFAGDTFRMADLIAVAQRS